MQNNVTFLNSSPTGAELLDEQLNGLQDNVLTSNSGVNRPSYAKNGTLWLDTSDTNAKKLKMFNGTSDVVIGTLNESTLTFTQSASNIASDVEFAGGTAVDKATNVKQVKSVDNTIAIKIYSPSTVYSLNQWVLGTVDGEIAIYQSLADNNNSILTDGNKWQKVELGGGDNPVVFSINEASKDASGNPNFMSVVGEQITFNGAVKYTQANGESKEYASVNPITLGYVDIPWTQPTLSSNGVLGEGVFSCSGTNNSGSLYLLFNSGNTSNVGFSSETAEINFYSEEKIKVSEIRWTTYDLDRNPVLYSISGSNDGVDYVELSSDKTAPAGSFTDMIVDNKDEYHYYKINVKDFNTVGGNCKGLAIKATTLENENGYVMLNNGVASVVPALEVQQNEPIGSVWEQPEMTSENQDGVTSADLWKVLNTNTSTYIDVPAGVSVGSIIYDTPKKLTGFEFRSRYVSGQSDTLVITKITGVVGAVEDVLWEGSKANSQDGNPTSWVFQEFENENYYMEYKVYYQNKTDTYKTRFYGFIFYGLNQSAINQTVWFNPYNNQVKQSNGTDWVDYNGVGVGTITDGVVYNYQYNTWKGVSPVLANASKETNHQINSLCVPDIDNGVPLLANEEVVAPFNLWLQWYYQAGSGGRVYLTINDVMETVELRNMYNNAGDQQGSGGVRVLPKGTKFKLTTTGWTFTAKYFPLKGEI